MKNLLTTAAFAFVLMTVPAYAGNLILESPAAVALPPGQTISQAQKVLSLALLDSRWLVESADGKSIVARRRERGRHDVTVRVDYGAADYRVVYVDSVDMNYGDTCPSDLLPQSASACLQPANAKMAKPVCTPAAPDSKPPKCIHQNYYKWIGEFDELVPFALQKLKLTGALGN